jgi:hypothetical protein
MQSQLLDVRRGWCHWLYDLEATGWRWRGREDCQACRIPPCDWSMSHAYGATELLSCRKSWQGCLTLGAVQMVVKRLWWMLQGAWQPVYAPATTVALRRAVGDFCVADMLEAALEGISDGAGAQDGQPAAAEAAGSGGSGSPASSGGSALSDSSWEVL